MLQMGKNNNVDFYNLYVITELLTHILTQVFEVMDSHIINFL